MWVLTRATAEGEFAFSHKSGGASSWAFCILLAQWKYWLADTGLLIQFLTILARGVSSTAKPYLLVYDLGRRKSLILQGGRES